MEDIVGGMNYSYSYSCLDEMCSEEADFMSQLLVKDESNTTSNSNSNSNLWDNIMYENSSSSSGGAFNPHVFPFPTPYPHPHDSNYHHHVMTTMDYCNDADVMVDTSIYQESTQREHVDVDVDVVIPSKKRSRIPGDNIPVVPRNKRGAKRPKVDDEHEDDDEDDNNDNAVIVKKSSRSSCSDSMTTNSTCSRATKARAGRGSATDPQSLYARKRRERINERLKVLQTLVPNGTKVDISTMLEEAVQYVKFLQLQIKLLSSDDLWMYAPIAYNGMDIGALNS